ncbi:MAG: hypothetical protein A2600_04020 [Candidatus Lambdaproteobacteria bacterium RIFOXYD1_FULL_56_27]|uniref:Uncharacterized protein n=1 Tax=Candidatus Lambdaproteobacteria bacterium RIFOXYD2_FULL_56_26 TaxID=1817773 RepID=A0A1F6H3N2_9PROT|nr:MAG: hypothetical protein A2426_01820 [Candidatus Lambdaproteobacteria bacterium RIFOXYC1_FULL_56_13]OGH04924.1 MAG: hypothetical protein A2557_08085 [Candidatus Lambdaproteobacteria bacterium RIFOXYD2_FULL_56_26]OGH09388.1 MAG: hypothetical protein A2600_04020 [Candidatus Lambdaproteobacteria bacterium RIFOXYD1_FULL_56_27]
MDFDRMMVRLEIEKVLTLLVKQTQLVEQRSLLEYYHEMFVDLKSLMEPICEYGSVVHLMVILPERLKELQKELKEDLGLGAEFRSLIRW